MKPLCEICNTRHESYQGHVFPRTPSRVTRKVEPPAAKPVVDAVANRSVANIANKESARVKRWRVANREKYNARERERMRARRAAGRVSA